MIVKLIGKIDSVVEEFVNLDIGGVVYEINCTSAMLEIAAGKISQEITLYVAHIFREDGQFLYGFSSQDEKNWFYELIKISGLGPKFAISLLSAIGTAGLYNAVLAKDENTLTIANGIGKKLAARIITELSSRVDKLPSGNALHNYANKAESKQARGTLSTPKISSQDEALEALAQLGFAKSMTYPIVMKKIADCQGDISAEDLIKYALTQLSKL